MKVNFVAICWHAAAELYYRMKDKEGQKQKEREAESVDIISTSESEKERQRRLENDTMQCSAHRLLQATSEMTWQWEATLSCRSIISLRLALLIVNSYYFFFSILAMKQFIDSVCLTGLFKGFRSRYPEKHKVSIRRHRELLQQSMGSRPDGALGQLGVITLG